MGIVLHPQQIAAALDAIAEKTNSADESFERSQDDEYGIEDPGWHLRVAYTQLLTLAEALDLPQLRSDIARDFEKACSEDLLATVDTVPWGERLKWTSPLRRYVTALQSTYGVTPSRTVTKDVESILRAATYPLCDKNLFDGPPSDEATLHKRLEGILKCYFTDLQRKPRLTKPIKHFEPDTGIPSIHTLIEYKFLSSRDQVASIADELLADTRGYHSKDWTSFIYVIYETSRIKPEVEWRQLMRDCGIDSRSTTVVVLTGEGRAEKQRNKRLPRAESQRAATKKTS